MGSTTTLVNPAAIQLYFSKNSMTNAVLSSDGHPIYTISTLDPAGSCTNIKDANTKQVLVTIKKKVFFSDTVTFADHYGGKSIKTDKWLKEGNTSDGSRTITIDTELGRFWWKTHVIHRFALYGESDAESPLAYMVLSRSAPGPSIVMEAETELFRTQILASLLIVEQKMRMVEKEYSVADGWVADNRTVFGNAL